MDKIGVVRDHRWMTADKQAEILDPRCRVVLSLGGGKSKLIDRHVDLDDLVMLAREGTQIELTHAFLLAEPRRKRLSGGMRTDFRVALKKIKARGAEVFDVTAVIGSDQPVPFLAWVDAEIGRSNRGLASAANGENSKRGRKPYEPTKQELKDAKAIWRDRIEYPEWPDADKALREQVNERFTAARAYDLWKGRIPKRT